MVAVVLGVFYRGYFFSNSLIISAIPDVEAVAFNNQIQEKTDSHMVHELKPHEISVSPPPKKQYSTKYLVVFLKKKILGAIENNKYVQVYYNINLPQDVSRGKESAADKLVPIGDYYVLNHELRGATMFMTINYPNAKDAAKALKRGSINRSQYDQIVAASKNGSLPPFNTPLGGPVLIRGDGIPGRNTAGNIGIPSAAMRKIWEFAVKGTPVRIVP